MGEDEHGVVVGRVVTPPARPLLVAPGAAVFGAEHVPAHHAGADVRPRFLEYRCALVHLAALPAVGPAEGGQRNDPVVQPLATLAERVLHALVRAGDESVQRDRDVTPEPAHRSSSRLGAAVRSGAVTRRSEPAPPFRLGCPGKISGEAAPHGQASRGPTRRPAATTQQPPRPARRTRPARPDRPPDLPTEITRTDPRDLPARTKQREQTEPGPQHQPEGFRLLHIDDDPIYLISQRPDDSLANHRHSAWIGGCDRRPDEPNSGPAGKVPPPPPLPP